MCSSYGELEREKSNFKHLFDKDTPSFVPFMYREEKTDATGEFTLFFLDAVRFFFILT